MAAGAVFKYLQEVYSQPNIFDFWSIGNFSNGSLHMNISLGYESSELTVVQEGSSTLPLSAAHFGLATGLLAILLNSHLVSSKWLKTVVRASEYQVWAEALLLRVFFATACLVLAATVAPIVAATFVLLALYRRLVHHVLSRTDPSYASLLEGTDTVWALEDDASRSIINVLAFFEVEIIDNVFKPQLLGMLRKLMRERILTSPDACPKFWYYRRRSRLGYFYWERQQEVRVEDHVQYMTQEDDVVNLDAPDLSEDSFRQEYYGMSESVLKGLVSQLANSPLPDDNAASWEILVGRDPILEDCLEVDPFEAMEEGKPEASGRYRRYPVLFRVHHSMGDGVALIKLLLEALADKDTADTTPKVTTTQVWAFDDDEVKSLNHRKRPLSRLDSINVIQCSTGSFDEVNRSKAKRPSFLDLSTNEQANKNNTNRDYPETASPDEDSEGSVENPAENAQRYRERFSKKKNILTSSLKEWVGDEVSFDDDETDGAGVYQRDLYCYPAPQEAASLDDSIQSASEIVLDHNDKTIYFDNKKAVTIDDPWQIVSPPLCRVEIFKDQSPPPRCKSPLPPFKRDVSRIARVLDQIPKMSTTPFLSDRPPPPPPYEAPVPRPVLDSSAWGSPFLKDTLPPTSKPLTPQTVSPMSRPATPHEGGETPTVRNESPVPKIHRKKYPVLWNDLDNEQSPATARKDLSTSRSSSPFMRFASPVPGQSDSISKFDSPFQKGNALKLQSDRYVPRPNSPSPRYNSSITSDHSSLRCNSPLSRNCTPLPCNDDLVPRCHSPILRNDSSPSDDVISRCNSPFTRNNKPLPRNDHPIPRCNSPFMRDNTPLPRNEHPIPRSNSPFMRDNTPLPRNDNPIPRCNSPLTRNNSPLPRNDNPIPRCCSPFTRNNTPLPRNDHPIPRCNSPFTRNNTPLPRNDHPIPRCNSPFMRNNSPHPPNDNQNSRCISPCMRNNFTLPIMNHSTDDVENKFDNTKAKNYQNMNSVMQDIPLESVPFDTHSNVAEKFIRGNFFCPDGEVYNRSSASPNCFIKLLDSINHRPTKIEHICNYVKNKCALVFAPATLIHQTMVKAADVNPLHGSVLSGEKVVSWYCDSKEELSDNLLNTIKRVKTRMSDARFTDVFLSALSASLESYFLQCGCDSKSIPDNVTVVVPVRMTTPDEIATAISLQDSKTGKSVRNIDAIKENVQEESTKFPVMENRFSVALLSLPLTSISLETKTVKSFSPIGRLREICKHTDVLRKSPDYQVNYWLMRVVSTYLPLPLLAPVLNSTQSTMVVSNLLGPPTQLELKGYKLKDIVFWVPNRGSTGVGVSVLSYSGRIQIGIVADRALISCQEDADIVIKGIILELKRLDEFTAPVPKHPLNA